MIRRLLCWLGRHEWRHPLSMHIAFGGVFAPSAPMLDRTYRVVRLCRWCPTLEFEE